MEFKETNYKVENIASIEKLDDFDDEYVYDMEVDDTHMFFANDVLVHNSVYAEFGRVCKYLNVPIEKQPKFCVDMWNYSLGPFMNNKYELYAKKYNCDKNLQVLELEKLSDVTLYFAKKRYAMSECWKEPNIYLPYMSKVIYKGLEIVKGSTSSYARECMEDFVKAVLNWYGEHDEKMPLDMLQTRLKKYKNIFSTKSPDEICSGSSIGDYEKFILDDKKNFTIADKCPAHVQAAGVYNFLLNQPKNKKYKVKYTPIKSADKVKWYYTTDKNYKVFAYLPGEFPIEFKLNIDYETMFEKTILTFCNKVLEICGHSPMTTQLCYSAALF